MNGALLGSKTIRDNLIKDNLGRYCLETFSFAKERWCVGS